MAKWKLGLGVAVLGLIAGCGTETPSADNRALANGQIIADNGTIVDPEVLNAAETNVPATQAPAAEPAAVKIAPAPPAAPKAKADAPKAKTDSAKAAPKPEPSPPPKAECAPEHRAAGHC